jgi:large subunit ribosomal protein L18
MANGPKYRVPFRRRREGKTNYHLRLKLIKSNQLRLVIRQSTKNCIVSFNEAKIEGDRTLVFASSAQLAKKFDWKYNSGNLSSAYLTGYLAGLEAKKANIEKAILDIGVPIHKQRIWASLKGVIDAGIEIPHGDIFDEQLEKRITGQHIKEYAEYLKNESQELYKKEFSAYIKNKVDPTKIVESFEKTKKEIEKKTK